MKLFAHRLAGAVFCALMAVLLWAGPARAADADSRVLILLAKGYNSGEFWMPYLALRGAGYDVDIAGPARGTIEAGRSKRDQDTTANLALDEVDVSKYVGLVIPGGYSPGNLEKHKEALAICTAFNKARKPIAAICHGPRLLMRAGLMKDRVGTCLVKVKDELADDWKQGGYGKYVDRSVVVHGNILTSRYPGDLAPFCRTMLRKLEAAGGHKAPQGRRKALIIAEDFDGHRKWIFSQVLGVLGIDTKVISPKDVDKLAGAADFKPSEYAVVAVVGAEKADKLARSDGMAKIVDAIDALRDGGILLDSRLRTLPKTVDEDERVTVTADSDGDWLKAIVSAAGKTSLPETPAEAKDEFVPLAAVVVQPGFNDAHVAAIEAGLQKLGYRTTALAASDAWLTGKQGLPIHAMPVKDWKPPQGYMSAAVMAKPVAVMAMVPARKDKMQEATMDAIRTLRPIADAVDAPAVALSEATAAIALRRGFDGRVVAAMKAILAEKGHKVALVWHEKDKVTGVNGMTFEPTATYAETQFAARMPLVVAPGSFFPEEANARQADQPEWVKQQAKRDQARLGWLLVRHKSGAVLLTFGMDSLTVGKDSQFKGKKFAASDQCVWSFGKSGGRYSGDKAKVSADRLISCEGPDSIGVLLRLLEEQKGPLKDVLEPDVKKTSKAELPVKVVQGNPRFVVHVDAAGRYVVDGKAISEEDLKTALQLAVKQNPKTVVAIHADEKARFSSAVKVADIAVACGLEAIQVGSRKK